MNTLSSYLGLLSLGALLAGCHLVTPYEGQAHDAAGPPVDSAADISATDGRVDAGDQGQVDAPQTDLPQPDLLLPDLLPPPDLVAPDAMVAPDGGCTPGWTRCGKICVKLSADPKHCGQCNAACKPAEANTCIGGKCICASAGKKCAADLTCVSGKCKCVPGSRCPGCCTKQEACIPLHKQTVSACGLAALCGTCNDKDPCTKDTCLNGKCGKLLIPGGACGGGKCDNKGGCCKGCLTSTKACQGGSSTAACGKLGANCIKCPAPPTCRKAVCNSLGKCVTSVLPPGSGCSGGKCDKNGDCCKYCLDSTNSCRDGNNTTHCGKAGGACKACKPTKACRVASCNASRVCVESYAAAGSGCSGGKCATDGNCCVGCLTSGKVCKAGTTTSRCGKAGATCKGCAPPPGKPCQYAICSNKACVVKYRGAGYGCSGGKCDSKGECCKGCLSGPNCKTGTNSTYCGKAGGNCTPCSTTQTCETASCATGACQKIQAAAGTPCSGGKCANNGNCCSGCLKSGVCVGTSSQNNASCGVAGANCAACGAGLDCKGGVCFCQPNGSCKGCCSTNGASCNTSGAKTACGTKGALCTNCTTKLGPYSKCAEGRCLTAASTCANTCNSGQCCQGSGCVSGNSDTHCGKEGQCEDCTGRGSNECTLSRNCFNYICTTASKPNGTPCNSGKGVCCLGICIASTVCP